MKVRGEFSRWCETKLRRHESRFKGEEKRERGGGMSVAVASGGHCREKVGRAAAAGRRGGKSVSVSGRSLEAAAAALDKHAHGIINFSYAKPESQDSFRAQTPRLATAIVTFTCAASHANLWPMTKGWMRGLGQPDRRVSPSLNELKESQTLNLSAARLVLHFVSGSDSQTPSVGGGSAF